MDLASDHDSTERLDHKYSDPPIGYINVRQPRARSLRPAVDVDQSDDEEGSMSRDHAPETTQHAQERFTPADPDPLAYLPPNRDNNARFARAPSSAGHIRHRGGAPAMSAHDVPRGAPQRRDSIMTASESSILSATSPSVGFDQRQQSVQSDTQRSEMPYRRPGKHRVGESPTPEEYMALPPEAKKKVDNRLSARRSRAKRKEHVHVLTTQITEQQQVIEMLRIENKQLNDHIANLSRAGYSLHPPPFPPSLVPHPSHLRHAPPPPPSHIHPRHLPPVSHPSLPPPIPSGSPRRSLLVASPGLSTHPSLASSSGLVAAAAPPTGPGQVPILTHHTRSEAGSSYAGQGQGSIRYESPGRGTKREVEDERDDRLRSRMRYASPDRSNWERDPEGRRLSHSAYRSPPAGHSQRKIRDHSRSPSPSPLRPQWGDLPPSLAAPQHLSGRRRSDYDPSEEVGDEQDPIEISGQGTVSDRLATLIRVHKRAITTYQATRRAQLSRREERMEGLLGAAEAIGKEVEEVTEEFRFVSQDGD